MIRRSRDSKFVIYQVLYIFVVTVLALKGAELNLGEVVKKDNVVDKSVRDSLMVIVDSLTEQGLKLKIQIDTNAIVENKELKDELKDLNKQVASLSKRIIKVPKKPKEEALKIKSKVKLPFPFAKNLTFLKYATNTAVNNGNVPVSIYSSENSSKPIVVVQPGSSKNFELRDENEVVLKYGGQENLIKVKPNLPPEIKINKVTTKMNKSDIYVKDLQRTTCFTVTITDERPEQIKIKYSGPIAVSKPHKNKKGQIVYNVSLKLASTESRYDDWIDKNENLEDNDGRYRVNFFFIVYDTKSKQKVQVGDTFYFTDFSK